MPLCAAGLARFIQAEGVASGLPIGITTLAALLVHLSLSSADSHSAIFTTTIASITALTPDHGRVSRMIVVVVDQLSLKPTPSSFSQMLMGQIVRVPNTTQMLNNRLNLFL